MPTTTCQCADSGCPACEGLCHRAAVVTVYRVDMDDAMGTAMCDECAADALSSGLFSVSGDERDE